MNKKYGFTLTEIMIVMALIAMLSALSVPAYMKYRENAQSNMCQGNLALISNAKEMLSLKDGLSTGDAVVNASVNAFIGKATVTTDPNCPAGGSYTYGVIDTDPTCTIGGDHVYIGL